MKKVVFCDVVSNPWREAIEDGVGLIRGEVMSFQSLEGGY